MGAESVSLTVNISSQIAEVLDPAVVPSASSAGDRTINHNSGGVNKTLTANDTPHPVRIVDLDVTLDASGYYELNLQGAPTTGAPDAGEDLAGLRLMHLEFETPSTNAGAIVVKPAASNGYHLWGSTFAVQFPAYTVAGVLFRGRTLPTIAAGARLIRFEGAEGDTFKCKLSFESAA